MKTKQTIIFLVIAAVLVLGIAGVVNYSSNKSGQTGTETTGQYTTTNPTATTPATTKPTSTTTTPPTTTTPSYTLAQVSTHKSASDCWAVVRTNVYNLTPWINKHPGGANAILGLCGRDGTSAFEDQHGGQRRPENELAGFEIGTYKAN